MLDFRAEELGDHAVGVHCQQSRTNVGEYPINFVPFDEITKDGGLIEVEHFAHLAESLIILHA